MNAWSEYDTATGVFTSVRVVAPQAPAAQRGRAWLAGHYNPAFWCVRDGAAHRTDADRARAGMESAARAGARGAIGNIEASVQRALREAVLALCDGHAPPAAALKRLRDADAAIAALRSKVQP